MPDYKKSIVLVGLMGAGKSSVGWRLARALGLPFFDADREIETAAHATIDEMFERYGEEFFRSGERRVIARLLEGSPHVLATGGGAFMDPDTRALIKSKAITVWLNANLDHLAERATRRIRGRPQLAQEGSPRKTLEHFLTHRATDYAEADITVASDAGPVEATVKAVLQALEDFHQRQESDNAKD